MKVLTIGVEEEFVLVDRGSGAPVNRAPAVIRAARAELGDQVQKEFFNAQVEICTRPTASCQDLREELARLRRTVVAAARGSDCRLIASGTPVLPPEEPLTVTDTDRYRRMARRFAAHFTAYSGLVCGCHVHIGTFDRERALAVANQMRPWLPLLQSLAGNSPFARRKDTGFASWRAVEHARWPTVGPAPVLDERQYLASVAALVSGGALLDRRMVYWHARPSEHVPTLEIRIADVNADLDTVVLLAALVRGLAATLLTDVEAHRSPPEVPLARLRLAHQLAAVHGLSGPGLHPETGEEQHAARLVEHLIARAAPGLEAAGDMALVESLWHDIRRNGNGATRQREVYCHRGSLKDVIDSLASATATA